MLTSKEKQECVDSSKVNEKDTGSSCVQISILTKRINLLNNHLKTNHKDNHSKRGLLQIISNRRKHIKYLKNKNIEQYNTLVDKLGLKK